jgi:hypothetical protein
LAWVGKLGVDLLSLLLARSMQALFWFFWLVFDARRKPDLSMVVPWEAAKVRRHMSGFSDWDRIRTFDVNERSNGMAVGDYFEIHTGLTAYYHRVPDFISTYNYPSSYGLAGRIIPLSADSTRVVARFRLTCIRSFAYSALVLAFAFSLAIGFIHSIDAAVFIKAFVLAIPLTLPLGALIVAVIGDLIAPDHQRSDMINCLRGMFGEYGPKST